MSSTALPLPQTFDRVPDAAVPGRTQVRSPEPGFTRIRGGILALSVLTMLLIAAVVVHSSLDEKRRIARDAQRESLTVARAVALHLEQVVARDAALIVGRRTLERAPGEEENAFAPATRAPDGRLLLPVTQATRLANGDVSQDVVMTLDGDRVIEYFYSLGISHQGAVALLTPRAGFLLRYPFLTEPPDASAAAAVATALVGTEGPLHNASPVDGTWRIGAYRRITDMPVYVAVTHQEEALFAVWTQNTVLRAAAGIAAMLLTALFTWLLLCRVQGERVAALNLSKFRRAVDLSGDMVYWMTPEGRVIYANDSAARRLGLDPRGIPATLNIGDFSRRYTPGQWSMLWSALAAHREFRYESEHVGGDGRPYPVEVAATHLEVDGQAWGFFVARDVSEDRRQKQRIQELNATLEKRVEERTAQLEAANAELEAFAYSVSHDLRAPVNHLSGYAEALGRHLDDPVRRVHLLERISERAAHMNDLIDALLSLSRITTAPLVRQEVDLSAMAREIDAELRREHPGRTVETTIRPGLRANADPVLLRTLLQNLVGNAWKYSSKVPVARIEVFAEAAHGTTTFVVRDNGAGFDPRYAGKLFGAFQRLHSPSEFAGNGVGLATVRRIVARHGGHIRAESQPGHGASFRFTLP